ncbi:MAG: Delta-aminolevulinic acid dehydratase [Alphaproteobacteria bacterium MarineAlpha2_Bin1]|nr:MAG: Delta-aminolevulinic acid dehydratase [Alphaproteobacteria bacterium MarineAlpha2_Bin1]
MIYFNSNRSFPKVRMRRNRKSNWSRRLVSENNLNVSDLIMPLFVIEGSNITQPILTMPGINRNSVDRVVDKAKFCSDMGIPAVALFPVIDQSLKSDDGSESVKANNLICKAIKSVKKSVPTIGIMCDVALDPYTSHGHDGILKDNEILNDKTVDILCRQAVLQADAGCDIIAPSDMMDGRIGRVRNSLDGEGFQNTQIMSYAAKYSSSFYGPFRDALGSADRLKGDKKTYQMDPKNSQEALHEVALDISEGADMIMIKPGLPYLDILFQVKSLFNVPTFAYQVSGEYSMLVNAIKNKLLPKKDSVYESLIAFKRAGANGIITYFAEEVAEQLSKR